MSKTFKPKFVALCMELILALSLAVSASAAGSDFAISNDNILTKYNGAGGAVTIPDSVTGIGGDAFRDCMSLTSVTIPDSVTSVGNRAFDGCLSLTSMTLSASVTKIGKGAFAGCTSLISVTIPDSVTEIGEGAFANCTSLTSVTIPGSITEMGISIFSGCTFLTNATFFDGVTTIEDWMFKDCTSLTNVTIPDSVTKIGAFTFEDCTSLTNVTIPKSVTEIGAFAFEDCTSLTNIIIPKNMTKIANNAFDGCTGLKDIYYAGSQTEWNKVYINDDNAPLKNAAIHYNCKASATQPAQPTITTTTAMPTNDALIANGAFQNPTVYKIGGSNYFKIRDLAAILNGTEKQFSVGYDRKLQSVTIATGQGYAKQSTDLAGASAGDAQTATVSKDTIYINSQKVNVEVYKIGGNNYFKLRDLGKALNFYVGWTKERGVFIETNKPYQD